MVTEPKQKAPTKPKRRRKPPEEFVDYIVVIEDWDWGYSALTRSGCPGRCTTASGWR